MWENICAFGKWKKKKKTTKDKTLVWNHLLLCLFLLGLAVNDDIIFITLLKWYSICFQLLSLSYNHLYKTQYEETLLVCSTTKAFRVISAIVLFSIWNIAIVIQVTTGIDGEVHVVIQVSEMCHNWCHDKRDEQQ